MSANRACVLSLSWLSLIMPICAQEKATLLVRTDLDCQSSIDGEPQGLLRVDDRVRVAVAIGEHLLEANGGGVHWEKVIDIKDTRSQVFSIPLLAAVRTVDGQEQKQQTASRGYWADPGTGLMWASRDNGYRVEWKQAATFCQKAKIGGFTGWVLPHLKELRSLRDAATKAPKGGVQVGLWVWTDSRDPGAESAWFYDFYSDEESTGGRNTITGREWDGAYALCVRRP